MTHRHYPYDRHNRSPISTTVCLSLQIGNLPFHGQVNNGVEPALQSPRPLPHLDVVAVSQAGGGDWGTQLGLGTSLGLLQGQQLGGR